MIYDWCSTRMLGGFTRHSRDHKFTKHHTFFLGREMYQCNCGRVFNPEEYNEYSKYLTARDKAVEQYHAKKI